eukprot:365048-Chlamydomonas_euryale.AAC.17
MRSHGSGLSDVAGLAASLSEAAWATCESGYTEPVRQYHNLEHLCAIFKVLDEACRWQQQRQQQLQQQQQKNEQHACMLVADTQEACGVNAAPFDTYQPIKHQQERAVHVCRLPTAVSLAVFYHDVVYNPRQPDNEEKSAELAVEQLTSGGANQQACSRRVVKQVHDLVMATKGHRLPAHLHDKKGSSLGGLSDATPTSGCGCWGELSACALFLDADLSILAQPSEMYLQYADAIRMEYGHLPKEEFRSGRAAVLQSLLQRDQLFYSDWAISHGMEAAARANLKAELEELQCDHGN